MTSREDENVIITQDATNSVYYILKAIKLIVCIHTTNSNFDNLRLPELVTDLDTNLEQVGKVLSTKDLRRTAWHFLDYGAATALILQNRLEISYASSYRYIKDLMAFHVIIPAIKSRHPTGKKRGPRPRIWMVPDATIDQVNEAQRLHHRLTSPKYRMAEKVAQLLLDDYLAPRQTKEITYREIITHVKELHSPFTGPDIANLAAQYLHEKGIKVWR